MRIHLWIPIALCVSVCGCLGASNEDVSTGDAPPSSSPVAAPPESPVTPPPPTGTTTPPPPADTPPPSSTPPSVVCTSNAYWTNGNSGSSSMNPGLACLSCHSGNKGPDYKVAGTLYPTVREPDTCRGASSTSGASVQITDATGATFDLTPNSAGNFYLGTSTAISFPITAKVVTSDGKVRAMVSPQMSGDCNSCHTQDGTKGAPGRVYLP